MVGPPRTIATPDWNFEEQYAACMLPGRAAHTALPGVALASSNITSLPLRDGCSPSRTTFNRRPASRPTPPTWLPFISHHTCRTEPPGTFLHPRHPGPDVWYGRAAHPPATLTPSLPFFLHGAATALALPLSTALLPRLHRRLCPCLLYSATAWTGCCLPITYMYETDRRQHWQTPPYHVSCRAHAPRAPHTPPPTAPPCTTHACTMAPSPFTQGGRALPPTYTSGHPQILLCLGHRPLPLLPVGAAGGFCVD